MKLNLGAALGTAYFVGFVACFGPATVQSEKAMEAHRAKCEAKVPDSEAGRQSLCILSGPTRSDGLFKAIFWPLWLSYWVAE